MVVEIEPTSSFGNQLDDDGDDLSAHSTSLRQHTFLVDATITSCAVPRSQEKRCQGDAPHAADVAVMAFFGVVKRIVTIVTIVTAHTTSHYLVMKALSADETFGEIDARMVYVS
jgi:hypothetical protein